MGKKKKARSKKTVKKSAYHVSCGYSCSDEFVTVGDWDSVSARFRCEDPESGCLLLHKVENVPEILCLEWEDLIDLEKEWGFGLVGYLASRFHVVTALVKMCERWNVPLEFNTHHSGWLCFRLADAASRAQVLNGGPYFVCGQPLLLKNIPEWFCYNEDDIHFLPVWIKLPGIPLECCNVSVLSHVASVVGKPIRVDELTYDCTTPSCARVLVEVDGTKPLVRSVPLTLPDGKEMDQRVCYEYEPKFCSDCKSVGHSSTNCTFVWTGLTSAPARGQTRPASELLSKQPASSENVETEMHWKSGQNSTPNQNGASGVSNHSLGQSTADIEKLSVDPPKSQLGDNGKSGKSVVLGDALSSSAADLTDEATCNKDPNGTAMVVDQDGQVTIPPVNSSLRHGELDDTCSSTVPRK